MGCGTWRRLLQEEVRPRSGEGGVNADEGVSRAGEGGEGPGESGRCDNALVTYSPSHTQPL